MIGMLSVMVILVAVVGAIGYASWSVRPAKLPTRGKVDVLAPVESSHARVQVGYNNCCELRRGRVELVDTNTYENVIGLLWR